ncbi:SURF1 family protein [Nocardioides hungaricus]
MLFALVVVLLCYAAWWLGRWQFDRLQDRKQSNGVVLANEERDPVPVTDVLSRDGEVTASDEWRQVTATGSYDAGQTVLVRYRTRDGQSGVDVLVPLVTADGTALIVNRGWMATDNQGGGQVDVPPPPTGRVTVDGWVRADTSGGATEVEALSTRAISSERIAQAIGYPVFDGFMELRSEGGQAAAGLQPVELPELNNGPHFFYGLQWWFFGVLAIVGFGYLAWDERRSARRDDESERTEVLGERKRRRADRAARKQAVRAAYQRAYEKERQERESARSGSP